MVALAPQKPGRQRLNARRRPVVGADAEGAPRLMCDLPIYDAVLGAVRDAMQKVLRYIVTHTRLLFLRPVAALELTQATLAAVERQRRGARVGGGATVAPAPPVHARTCLGLG